MRVRAATSKILGEDELEDEMDTLATQAFTHGLEKVMTIPDDVLEASQRVCRELMYVLSPDHEGYFLSSDESGSASQGLNRFSLDDMRHILKKYTSLKRLRSPTGHRDLLLNPKKYMDMINDIWGFLRKIPIDINDVDDIMNYLRKQLENE
jgi:hypothetical protein